MNTASVQFSSVAQLCPTLCDPMNHSTPGLPVHHQLLEFTETHVHPVSDAIQPSLRTYKWLWQGFKIQDQYTKIIYILAIYNSKIKLRKQFHLKSPEKNEISKYKLNRWSVRLGHWKSENIAEKKDLNKCKDILLFTNWKTYLI